MVRWKLLEHEFILYAGHHSHIPHLLANMDAICWGKATIAREPSNKHKLYAVAVLDSVGGGAAGGSGGATRLCTVKPKASICSGCQYRSKGVLEAIPALGQAFNKDTKSCMQARSKEAMSYMQAHNNNTRSF